MLLKTIIIVLLIGLLISLGSGLVFLFKDVGTTRRTLHSLGVRITLAATLMITTVYGFFSGQLEIGAPWDARKTAIVDLAARKQGDTANAVSDDIDKEEQADPDHIDKVPVP